MNKKAVTAQDVKEQLESNDYITKAAMAENLGVSTDTIRNRLRTLREGDEPIIFSNDGLSLLNKEILADPTKANELKQHQDWIIGVVKAMMVSSKTIKPLLPTMRKTLMVSTTIEERRLIKQNSARMLALMTLAEADEEMS